MTDKVHYLGSALDVIQWSKFVATKVTQIITYCIGHVLVVAVFRCECPCSALAYFVECFLGGKCLPKDVAYQLEVASGVVHPRLMLGQ
eukprot:8042910-Ditylum_brightwellii.AAC.1